jgi:hypothetical protein
MTTATTRIFKCETCGRCWVENATGATTKTPICPDCGEIGIEQQQAVGICLNDPPKAAPAKVTPLQKSRSARG